MIGFSFDAPGSHFADAGLWFRLLLLWPPVSLLLVADAARERLGEASALVEKWAGSK